MSDSQGRHAAPSGRHLAPDSGAPQRRGDSPRRYREPEGERPGRHSGPEEEYPRQRRVLEEEEYPRRRRVSEEEEYPRQRRVSEEEEYPRRRRVTEEEEYPRRRRAAEEEERPRRRRGPEERPKRRKWFKTIMLAYLIVLGLCTAYLQIRLWVYLDHSQAEMDRAEAEQAEREAQERALYRAPQLAFEQWQSEQSAEDWTERWYAVGTVSPIETRERLNDYMEEIFAPDAAQAYKDASYTDDAPVYIIKNGEQPLARVTLNGQGLSWTVSNVELLMDGDRAVTVTAPSSCLVSFNGVQLDEQYRQPAESLLLYEPIKGQLETPVTWVSYTVEGLLADPEVTVTPPEGFETLQREDGSYLITLPEGNVGNYPERSVDFVKTFLNYYMNGYSNTRIHMNAVLGYLRQDTQAYQDILDTYSSVSWASNYLSIDTSKTYAGDVIVWANNCFSVDVTYDADAVMLGEEVDYADATMRVYYMKADDGFYISHFETL